MTTITCPAWCDSHIEERDGTLLGHRGECDFETEDGDRISLTLLNEVIPSGFSRSWLTPAGSWVEVNAVDCHLSPADARRAAAALLRAADQAEGQERLAQCALLMTAGELGRLAHALGVPPSRLLPLDSDGAHAELTGNWRTALEEVLDAHLSDVAGDTSGNT